MTTFGIYIGGGFLLFDYIVRRRDQGCLFGMSWGFGVFDTFVRGCPSFSSGLVSLFSVYSGIC